jgi:transcriptional regulator with XRE-family HTH domain
MSRRLPNYLKMHRRRARLSQAKLAYLIGNASGTKVSRYELDRRLPNLETALALQAATGVPVAELFGGIYDRIEEGVLRRRCAMEGEEAGQAGHLGGRNAQTPA